MAPVPEGEGDKPTHDTNVEIEDTEYPDVVINAESSDSDDDDDGDPGYMGYQTLSQDPGGADSDQEEMAVGSPIEPDFTLPQSQEADPGPEVPVGLLHNIRHEEFPNSPNLPRYMQVPDVPRPDKTDLLWNQSTATDIRLDTGQTDKIKSLMTGIQIPSSNIPDWARGLSDDQWQAQVVTKLVSTSPKQEVDSSCSKQTENPTDSETKENS